MFHENEDEDINTLLRKAEETIRENITEYLQYEELNNSHSRRNFEQMGITSNPTINIDRNKSQEENTAPPVTNVNPSVSNVNTIQTNNHRYMNAGDVILIDSSPSTTPTISRSRATTVLRIPSSPRIPPNPTGRTARRKRQRLTRSQQSSVLLPDPVHIINLDDYDDSTPLYQDVIINETNNNSVNIERSTTEENSNARTLSLKCAICLDLIQTGKAASTICGHVFCKSCIMRTFQMTKKCPLCNRKLSKNAIHPLYLE